MIIHIQTGGGEGETRLAAFDAALQDAGIHDYNLLELSSVIPTGAAVRRGTFQRDVNEIGFRLYVVLAHTEVTEPGEERWAGLGWVQDRTDGHGLFVELTSDSEAALDHAITVTLGDMMRRRGGDFGPIERVLVCAAYRDKPAAALAAAVYRSKNWD